MSTDDALRAWARGSLHAEAAVELLARAFAGRFAQPGQPWIVTEPNGTTWIDVDRLDDSLAVLSGGERRILNLVAALVDPARPIDIGDLASGVDRDHLDLALAAIAHAGGSHQHALLVRDEQRGTARLVKPGPVHGWPGEPGQGVADETHPSTRKSSGPAVSL